MRHLSSVTSRQNTTSTWVYRLTHILSLAEKTEPNGVSTSYLVNMMCSKGNVIIVNENNHAYQSWVSSKPCLAEHTLCIVRSRFLHKNNLDAMNRSFLTTRQHAYSKWFDLLIEWYVCGISAGFGRCRSPFFKRYSRAAGRFVRVNVIVSHHRETTHQHDLNNNKKKIRWSHGDDDFTWNDPTVGVHFP